MQVTRYTFFLPENGQIQTVIREPEKDRWIRNDIADRFLFVPDEKYDIYIPFEQLKCVMRETLDDSQLTPNLPPETKFEPIKAEIHPAEAI